MNKKEWVKFWQKFWFIVWKDQSLKGWIISLIFIFIVVKFITFPLLELATGTALPLAIVESCSMYHDTKIFSNENLDNWWSQHEDKYENLDINKTQFEGFIFRRGFTKGDILFITGVNPDKLEVGNVIIFTSGTQSKPIIHRIIEIDEEDGERFFKTIGDNNKGFLTARNNPGGIDETRISEEQIVGQARFVIAPWLGWTKLIFFEHERSLSEKGFCEER